MFQIQDAVSETLLIPLYMRYRESLKPNPIIHDESALRLIPQSIMISVNLIPPYTVP